MRLLRSFPMMALLLVLMSITGFCIAQHTAGQQGVGLLIVAGTLAALSWYITEGPRGRVLPRWVANLLTGAVAINVVVDLLQNLRPDGDIMGVLGRFTVWLTLIKLYERKSPRDYSQLLALSALLMLVGCLQSPKLLFGVSLFLYTVHGLYVLLLFQLYCSFERAKAERSATTPEGYRLAPVVQPIVGRGAGLQVRSLVAGIVVVGMAMSAAVFVVAPRGPMRAGWGSRATGPGEPTAGFDDQIDLTTGDRISDSPRIVATMRLLDAEDHPVPLGRPPLLRGAVLTRYDGKGHWSARDRDEGERLATQPPNFTWVGKGGPVDLPATATVYTQQFTILPRERSARQRTLFSMGVPLMVGTDLPTQFFYDPRRQTLEHADVGGGWLSSYRIRATPEIDDATGALLSARREPVYRLNNFGPRIQDLARQLLTEAGLSPAPPEDRAARFAWHAAAAKAFTRHLQSPAFRYVTDLSSLAPAEGAGDQDPIERFLFETRSGHCEYFASALVALCQSVDVPARVVTGYAAVEYDISARQYIIRDSSAHAWAEVHTGRFRSTTFDPTPPGALGDVRQAGTNFADWMRSLYDRLEFTWYNGVAGYDSRLQSRIVGDVGARWTSRLQDLMAAAMRRAESINRSFDLGPAGYVWLGIVAFAVLLAMVAAVKIVRRVVRLRSLLHPQALPRRDYQRMLRQLGFYLDMLGVLDRSGYGKPMWQPPRAYAKVLRRRQPAAGVLVAELTDLFYSARYGRHELDREQLVHAHRLLQSLAAALKVAL